MTRPVTPTIPIGVGGSWESSIFVDAFIALNPPGQQQRMRASLTISDYIAKHIDSWVDFARSPRFGENLDHDQIVLIVGTVKTSQWIVGVRQEHSTQYSGRVSIQVNPMLGQNMFELTIQGGKNRAFEAYDTREGPGPQILRNNINTMDENGQSGEGQTREGQSEKYKWPVDPSPPFQSVNQTIFIEVAKARWSAARKLKRRTKAVTAHAHKLFGRWLHDSSSSGVLSVSGEEPSSIGPVPQSNSSGSGDSVSGGSESESFKPEVIQVSNFFSTITVLTSVGRFGRHSVSS